MMQLIILCLQYKNPDVTKKDIQSVINQYKGLSLQQETYGKIPYN